MAPRGQGGAVGRNGILFQRAVLLRVERPRPRTVLLQYNAIRFASLLLLSAVLSAQTPTNEAHYRALVPLGAEAYELQGEKWRSRITLLASAENPQFEGMVRRAAGRHEGLFSADGTRVHFYPERISFRVTASLRTRIIEASPFPISATSDANDYLLHLQFRIVVFDGLRQTVIQPDAVEMIGMPGEVPYDERIYRVVVELPHVPLRDRVVLEVRDSGGDRICKFHLDIL